MDSSELEVMNDYEIDEKDELDRVRFHNMAKLFRRDDFVELKEESADGQEQFLFAVCLHLGLASNNYAEYVGVILA